MKLPALFLGAIPAAAGVMLMSGSPMWAQSASTNPTVQTPSTQAPTPGALCGNRDEIVKSLTEQFKESPQAVGVVDENAVLEIFVSASGTWTIIATGTDGNSCLVSSGEGWDSKTMVAGYDA